MFLKFSFFFSLNPFFLISEVLSMTMRAPQKLPDYYSVYFMFIFFCFFIACLLLVLTYFFSLSHSFIDRQKRSTYECGFEPYVFTRNNFYLQFYIIALLFILFDIETVFLLPWCFLGSLLTFSSFIFLIIFFFILTLGFVLEYLNQSLIWV